MKAMVNYEYGSPDVLFLTEIKKPLPRENEILIKVHATSVNFGDTMARNFKAISPRQFNMPFLIWLIAKLSFGLSQPNNTILGNEFAGQIEAVGRDIKRFKPGDQVFGYAGEIMGAYAEYLCIPENGFVAMKPSNLTYEEAAVVPYGAVMALPILRRVNIQPGQKVLINGASGGIGSAALQIAKFYGAEVTGVCGPQRVGFVRSLGADNVIDYSKEDFSKGGEAYDLIIDILGKSTFSKCKSSLSPKGVLLFVSFKLKQILQMLWTSGSYGKKVICVFAQAKYKDLHTISRLIEAGKYQAVIDKTFPLEQIAEAHRYVEEGHKKGSIAILIA